jgi:hypothetical protein
MRSEKGFFAYPPKRYIQYFTILSENMVSFSREIYYDIKERRKMMT